MSDHQIAGSNLENFDKAREVRSAASKESFDKSFGSDAGAQAGLWIWRIENFETKRVPEKQYGQFFHGDSYLVLHTYTKGSSKTLQHDLFFWLGKDSTADEQGTAAYKAVELDEALDDLPVQHREVDGHESDKFLALFGEESGRAFRVLEGGVASGFNHVEEPDWKPKLFQLKGTAKHTRMTEVPARTSSLNKGDVFVLDAGKKIFIWQPASASRWESLAAGRLSTQLRDERGSCEEVRLDEGGNDEFWGFLEGEQGQVKSAEEGGKDAEVAKSGASDSRLKLWKLSDASGELKFTQVADAAPGTLSKDELDTNDVFILDPSALSGIFVWVGKGTTQQEKRGAMKYGLELLKRENKPPTVNIEKVLEGNESPEFKAHFQGF